MSEFSNNYIFDRVRNNINVELVFFWFVNKKRNTKKREANREGVGKVNLIIA